MKAVSGNPAHSAQRTLDCYFDLTKLKRAKEFIIAPRDMGRMIYDFEEYDTQDEKDALWGGY